MVTELARAMTHRGRYRGSREGLLPLRDDPPSIVPLAAVLGLLMASPASATNLAHGTIARYALGNAIDLLADITPETAGLR